VKEEIWKTLTGVEIPVGDLTEEHAKNALRMLLRQERGEHAKHRKVDPELDDMVVDGCDRYGSLG
jgi:hypothetical protein